MKLAAHLLLFALLSLGARAELGKVGVLSFDLPPGFVLQPAPESRGEAEVKRWQAPDGSRIEVFVYDHYIKQDRGGIVAASKDSLEVAGQRTKVILTKIFFGEPKQVLAVYLNFGDRIYLFVGDGVPERVFLTFLRGINHEE